MVEVIVNCTQNLRILWGYGLKKNGSKKYGFNGFVYMVMVANGGVSVDDGSSSSNMMMVF